MEEKKESLIKSLGCGILSGLFALIPGGGFGPITTTGFMSNFMERKPKTRWIGCGILIVLGLILATWTRLIMGMDYLETNFPLATYLFILFCSIGLGGAIITSFAFKKEKEKKQILWFSLSLLCGLGLSIAISILLKNELENSLGTGALSNLVTGFVLGFCFLLPGLPIKPFMNALGMTSYAKQMMINIADRVEISNSIMMIAIMLLGALINIAVFYYPYRLLYKKCKEGLNGLSAGLIIGSSIGAFIAHGDFAFTEYPAKFSGEIQNIAEWGFALAGIIIALVLIFAFGHLPIKSKEDMNDNKLFEQNGVQKKKRFFFWRRG